MELDHVEYKVPERDESILKDVSLRINTKSRILVRGESGSGKSSLLRLISGIIKPTKGKIFVNEHSLETINLNYYRSKLGLSLADETPFEGTIRENITFGDESITDEQLMEVIKNVGLSQFIKESDQGLNTVLYPEGKQISFTVAKKIVLARAVVVRPKLLILEDPLEHFENDEANAIIDFLTDSKNPWALIVVSINDNWAKQCTQVITLKKGQII